MARGVKELVYGGVSHHHLDPVISVRPVARLAGWALITFSRLLHPCIHPQLQAAKMMVKYSLTVSWVGLCVGTDLTARITRSCRLVMNTSSKIVMAVLLCSTVSMVNLACLATTHTVRTGPGGTIPGTPGGGMGTPVA